jgi:hypothetical protein
LENWSGILKISWKQFMERKEDSDKGNEDGPIRRKKY